MDKETMPEVSFRTAIHPDIKHIDYVDSVCFKGDHSSVFGEELFNQELVKDHTEFVVCLDSHRKVIGYCIAWSGPICEIVRMAVLPLPKRRGIASLLLCRTIAGALAKYTRYHNKLADDAELDINDQRCQDIIKTQVLQLEVDQRNDQAIDFYEKAVGLIKNEKSIIKNYYGTGHSAYLMKNKITELNPVFYNIILKDAVLTLANK